MEAPDLPPIETLVGHRRVIRTTITIDSPADSVAGYNDTAIVARRFDGIPEVIAAYVDNPWVEISVDHEPVVEAVLHQ